MNIVLIGSGNVANILGRMIKESSHQVVQVVSRNGSHAKILGDELNCSSADLTSKLDLSADMYLFAVADMALAEMDKFYNLGDKLAVHTGGSVSKDELKKISSRYGVLYPVQSLHKDMQQIPDIPFLVDGSDEDTTVIITQFARELSPIVCRTSDEQRLKLHVAAVFVNNFTNHLYMQAENFCESEHLDFNLLKPLITETAQRILTHSPKDVQTGPASRNDVFTLERHLRALTNYPRQKYLYLKLTDSIINR